MAEVKDKWEEKLKEIGKRGKMVAVPELVKKVMSRQAGKPKKGIRELMQNAFDSHDLREGEELPIQIKVEQRPDESVLYFADSGVGWAKDPLTFYRKMKLVGHDWKDEARGEFGIGRGQALSMIYDPDVEDYVGEAKVTTLIDSEPWTITNFGMNKTIHFDNPKKGIDEKKLGDPEHGAQWTIVSPDPEFFTEEGIRDYVRKNVIGEYPVEVNGELVTPETRGEKHKIEFEVDGEKYEAVLYLERRGIGGFDVYNRGIKVARPYFTTGWCGKVLTKFNLPATMSRENIDRKSDVWKKMKRKIQDVIANKCKTASELNSKEREGMANLIQDRGDLRDDFKYREVFKLADGSYASFSELGGYVDRKGKLLSGDMNKITGRMIDCGIPVLDESELTYETKKFFAEEFGLSDPGDEDKYTPKNARKSEEYSKRASKEYKKLEMTHNEKLMAEAFERIQSEAGMRDKMREIRFGEGPNVNAWTDGRSEVVFAREEFDNWVEKADESPADFIQTIEHLFPHFVHEVAHDEDTRGSIISHQNIDWFRNWKETAEKFMDAKNDFLDSHRSDSGWSFDDVKESVNVEMLKYLPGSETKSKQVLEEEVTGE